jgi:hypothetical protein
MNIVKNHLALGNPGLDEGAGLESQAVFVGASPIQFRRVHSIETHLRVKVLAQPDADADDNGIAVNDTQDRCRNGPGNGLGHPLPPVGRTTPVRKIKAAGNFKSRIDSQKLLLIEIKVFSILPVEIFRHRAVH